MKKYLQNFKLSVRSKRFASHFLVVRTFVFALVGSTTFLGSPFATAQPVPLVATPLTSPNVSANTLFLYRNSNLSNDGSATTRNGADLQEVELAFFADVDPYTKLKVLLSLHPEYTKNGSFADRSWKFEPEEVFAESNVVPGFALKLGKFKTAFGKHNLLHNHAFPFVDAPLANTKLLGPEGLADSGISAAYLLPTSAWFSELTFQYIKGEGGDDKGGGSNIGFNSSSPNDGILIGHWKNLFDFSDSLTFEAGASAAKGKNYLDSDTQILGADLTFKWRPVLGGKYNSWLVGFEYIDRRLDQTLGRLEKSAGGNIWGQYQFAERWNVLARAEIIKTDGTDTVLNPAPRNSQTNDQLQKSTIGLRFAATEFSSYRIEYSQLSNPGIAAGAGDEKKIYLQANFTIGSHPAHSY
jgi:hypothetical protein